MKAAVAFLFAALLQGPALAASKLEVIVFFGGANWPLWVAADKGMFAAQGLDVHLTSTPGSVYLAQNLVGGKFDIAFTTFDNVPAYDEGQGEARLDRPADLFAFMGGLTGGLRLMAQPDIRTIADLKGRKLGVDSPDTGYSLAMRKMLERGGLAEGEYGFENMGGTGERTKALMEGKTVATIVTSPLDLLPRSKGYPILADSKELGPYQATLYVARREWARAHEAELVSFIRAQLEALRWLADPAHRDEAVAIYRKHLPNANEQAAQKAWTALLATPGEGLAKDGRIDRAGTETVLKLRSEYGHPKKTLTDPDKYLDESYYRKAVARMAGASGGSTGMPPKSGQAESSNMALVGYNDLQARSAYQPLVHKQGNRFIAYIGHHGGKSMNPLTGKVEDNGTSVLDVTDPKQPRMIAHIPGEPGDGESGGAQMVRVCDGATLPKADKSKFYLLRTFGNLAHEVWDVTDPAKPSLVSTVVKVKGTHKSWWECDTGIAYLVSGLEGWRVRRMTQVFDLSDPAHPRHIRDFGLPGQQPGSQGEAPEELHGMISVPERNRIYFGYGTNKRGIMQIVDRKKLLEGAPEVNDANLKYPEVSRLYLPPTNGAHTTFPVLGVDVAEFARDKVGGKRDIAVVVDESLANECTEARQMVWIADITAEKQPFNIASYTVPEASGDFCSRGGRFGSHSSNENMTPIYYKRMVFVAFFNAGVRAIDIRDPYHPKEAGYYIPAVTDKTDKRCVGKGADERCKIAIQTNNVDVDDRGYIYIADRANTGLHILEVTGEARNIANFR